MGAIEEYAEAAETDFLIFTGNFCGYCAALKRYLPSKGMTFTEYNMDEHSGLREDVVNATRHRTVPVVFDLRNGTPEYIGGFDETRALLG
ncbi:MAG: glutaredoxin [Candidatus Poseidoniaceae archaeon]|jgi:glutaredoxin|nr:glutaredoxin [Candidatus Poseidoniaceae archaeon]MDP7203186.1 glutaredoxin [Candidatus Poseidoniaceae archaeon]|tara:strand:- start:67 stop:336 length:270 start_codon:yes stop_codon:yes gene_type:complete